MTQLSFFRAVFKFEGNNLNVTATGKDFKDFKSAFTNDDRGFGYIRISVSIYKNSTNSQIINFLLIFHGSDSLYLSFYCRLVTK